MTNIILIYEKKSLASVTSQIIFTGKKSWLFLHPFVFTRQANMINVIIGLQNKSLASLHPFVFTRQANLHSLNEGFILYMTFTNIIIGPQSDLHTCPPCITVFSVRSVIDALQSCPLLRTQQAQQHSLGCACVLRWHFFTHDFNFHCFLEKRSSKGIVLCYLDFFACMGQVLMSSPDKTVSILCFIKIIKLFHIPFICIYLYLYYILNYSFVVVNYLLPWLSVTKTC